MRACVCSDQQSVWQEGSQMLIKNLLHPPQWQWDYEANAPFHTYPSSWSGEVEEKMALQTLSSALLCPSNTHTEQPVCMQSPSNWCQNGALSPFLTEYLSNSLKLSVCLKVIDLAMDAVGWIKGEKSGFCYELKEPVGAHYHKGSPEKLTDLQNTKGILNINFSEVTTTENINIHSRHITSTGGCCS